MTRLEIIEIYFQLR